MIFSENYIPRVVEVVNYSNDVRYRLQIVQPKATNNFADESGVTTVQKLNQVVAGKGIKRNGKLTSKAFLRINYTTEFLN